MNFASFALRALVRAGCAIVLAALSLAACGDSQPPAAAVAAYEFSALTPEVPMAGGPVDVRLLQKASGNPVAGAVIFETRFDMEPDGMGSMAAQATAEGSPEPGVYRFMLKPTMAGRWALKLSAKVQGETETVRGTVIITAR